jgi:hypothetical protein
MLEKCAKTEKLIKSKQKNQQKKAITYKYTGKTLDKTGGKLG